MCICDPEFFWRFAVLLLCDISRTDAASAVITPIEFNRFRFALRADPQVFRVDVIGTHCNNNAVTAFTAPVVLIHSRAIVRRVVWMCDYITVPV